MNYHDLAESIVLNPHKNGGIMQKWEYLRVNTRNRRNARFVTKVNNQSARKQTGFFVHLTDFDEYINQLGEEGWELVTAVGSKEFIFKRPKL